MTTLPDIDTSTVSFVGYWNAIDQGGVESIAPEEALSASNVQGYSLYDNGWEGIYSLTSHRTATVRVKNDGWVLVYLDNTENDNLENSQWNANAGYEDWKGPWDILHAWNSNRENIGANSSYSSGSGFNPEYPPNYPASLSNSAFHRAINALRKEFSNSDKMTWTKDDVGIYNYAHTSATTATLLTAQKRGSGAVTPSFLYTSDTTRNWHVAIGVGSNGHNSNSGAALECSIGFNSHPLVQLSPSNTSDNGTATYSTNTVTVGTVDVLSQGLAPNSGTEYLATLNPSDNDYNPSQYGAVHQLILWE